jgi:tRNA(fMet)-specific endonuclease VapC
VVYFSSEIWSLFNIIYTNICIYLIKKKPQQVINKFQSIKISDVGISSITLSELEYGVEKSQNKKQNRLALIQFLTPLEIKVYDHAAANFYGKIRSKLEKIGKPIGSLDFLIAAHALSLQSTLITNNVKEFDRISDLKIENWAL